MNPRETKVILPQIKSKTTPNLPSKAAKTEKQPLHESPIINKTKTIDKNLDSQRSQPKSLNNFRISRPKEVKDTIFSMSSSLSKSLKNQYSAIHESTNSLQNIQTTAKKPDVPSQRQSRFETSARQIRITKDHYQSDNSNNNSPDKKAKKVAGNQTVRSKSELSKISKPSLVFQMDGNVETIKELDVIDSMEIDDMDEGGTQCEIDKETPENVAPNAKVNKKRKGYTALSEMVPLNLEEEKNKFFEKSYKYNPQFEYNNLNLKQQFDKPHVKYLKVAKMILNACLKDFGDDETYLERTGGRLITQQETEDYFNNYIKELDLEGHLDIVFQEKTVAPTSVIHDPNGKSKVVISLPINYRTKRITGVMHHEIGTHFIRKYNDRLQPWFKNRKKFELKPYLIIEEGLASLNQTLEAANEMRYKPYLWNSALHYYSAYMSSILGFEALFVDLEKYIKDPIKRWRECVRVKRGIADTSQPGGMYKDQVYLRGNVEILQKRKNTDFAMLHSGKINLKDLRRLAKNSVIKTDNIKMPAFMSVMNAYKAALDRIAEANFIDTIK